VHLRSASVASRPRASALVHHRRASSRRPLLPHHLCNASLKVCPAPCSPDRPIPFERQACRRVGPPPCRRVCQRCGLVAADRHEPVRLTLPLIPRRRFSAAPSKCYLPARPPATTALIYASGAAAPSILLHANLLTPARHGLSRSLINLQCEQEPNPSIERRISPSRERLN